VLLRFCLILPWIKLQIAQITLFILMFVQKLTWFASIASAALVGTTLCTVLPATALTITTTAGPQTSEVGATTIDFNSAALGTPNGTNFSGATYTGGVIVNGNVSGQYASPLANNTNYIKVGATNETLTIVLPSLGDYFGAYMGSLDNYNGIAFFNGQTQIASFNGTQVSASCNGSGNQTSTACNPFVNFLAANSTQYFNRVVMTSSAAAFETDNHAFRSAGSAPAPVPPALLGTAFTAAIGAWKVRKQKRALGPVA
jgi:hypothetical protein